MRYITLSQVDIKKINYFLIFLIIALPWFYFSEGISYDLFLYKDFDESFKDSFLRNKLALYFFSKILFFVDATYRIKIIHLFCVLPLLVILSKKCEPKYFLSIILFLFFSLFSGQFRMSLSLFFIILSIQQENRHKNVSLILAILSHYVAIFYYLYRLIKRRGNFIFKLFVFGLFFIFIIVNWYLQTDFFKKIEFYFSSTEDYSILFIIPFLLLLLEFKNLKENFFEFLLVAVFTGLVYHFYDLSSRITELLIFSMLFYAGSKFYRISTYTVLFAVIFFLYRFSNIFFFSGKFRYVLLDYFF